METFEYQRLFHEAAGVISKKQKILLATHEHPDGDALGSMIAMFSVLADTGEKEVVMFSKDPMPSHFEFLPYVDRVVSDVAGFLPELLIAFDYGDFERLQVCKDAIRHAETITFDHHPYHKQKGEILIIDPSRSSTSELLYYFFHEAGYRISHDTAVALLTGIISDTGGFTHTNTSRDTLRIAGDLLYCGASLGDLYGRAFSQKSPHAIRAWGRVLQEMARDRELGMAYVAIPFSEFEDLGVPLDDFDGIGNVIAMPEEVRFSLLLIEHRPRVMKGSLRSEPFKKTDVSLLARALGGGGHPYAAGFEREGESLQDVIQCVKKAARELV